jgi:hypothetical protein
VVRAVVYVLLIISLGCHWRAAGSEASGSLPFSHSRKYRVSLASTATDLLILAQADVDSVAVPDSETDPTTATPTTKRKLDRRTKIELMFILVMLVAVGLGLLAFTWFTARLTRRYMKPSERLPARRPDPVFTDDWATKPLTEQERARLDNPEW